MRKKAIVLLACLQLVLIARAQQDPYLTHFAYNKVLFNPANAGSGGAFCLAMVNHRQWLQLPEQTGLYRTESGLSAIPNIPTGIGPVTNGFSFSAPFSLDPNVDHGGIYAAAVSDVIAYEKNTMFKLGVAGAIPLGNDATLRVGIDATNQTKRWNTAALRAMDMPDPLIPVAGNPADSKWLLGGGIYLKVPSFHNFRTGLSMSAINPVQFQYMAKNPVYISSARHLYYTAGFRWNGFLGYQALTMEPNLMVRTVSDGNGWVKPQTDLQALVTYSDKFSAGAGIRTQALGADAAYLMIGIYPIEALHLKKNANQTLRIGYAYDFTLQSLRLSSRNTQEIQVNFCFMISDPPEIINHPREVRPHRFIRFPRYWFSD